MNDWQFKRGWSEGTGFIVLCVIFGRESDLFRSALKAISAPRSPATGGS